MDRSASARSRLHERPLQRLPRSWPGPLPRAELSPSGSTLGTFPQGSPEGLAFDGAHMWVAGYSTNTVTEL
jgi:hypothetical protein